MGPSCLTTTSEKTPTIFKHATLCVFHFEREKTGNSQGQTQSSFQAGRTALTPSEPLSSDPAAWLEAVQRVPVFNFGDSFVNAKYTLDELSSHFRIHHLSSLACKPHSSKYLPLGLQHSFHVVANTQHCNRDSCMDLGPAL